MSETTPETPLDRPKPFMSGQFSLYREDSGSVMMVWRENGQEGPDSHILLPAPLIRLARQRAEGKGFSLGMLRELAGL